MLKEALAINPGFTIAGFRANAYSDRPFYLENREKIVAGLVKVGAPR